LAAIVNEVKDDSLSLTERAENRPAEGACPEQDFSSIAVTDDNAGSRNRVIQLDDSLHLGLLDLPGLEARGADASLTGI
jgi:hypothetical protein